jgi:hypothetical protein
MKIFFDDSPVQHLVHAVLSHIHSWESENPNQTSGLFFNNWHLGQL